MEQGLTFDLYPLIIFQIDFALVATVFALVVYLRIRKLIQNRKRKLINKKIPSEF